MAFGGFDHHNKNAKPMSEINVTPMVDVMLVLLVIFIIAAPLFTHSIMLDLPNAQSSAAPQNAQTVSLSIDSQGQIFWNNDAIDAEALERKLAAAAKQQPQPELQLRADKETRYEVVAQVMSAAQTNGLSKLGFVTEPKEPKGK